MKQYRLAGMFEMVINAWSEEHAKDIIGRLEVAFPDGQGFHLHTNSINEVKPK